MSPSKSIQHKNTKDQPKDDDKKDNKVEKLAKPQLSISVKKEESKTERRLKYVPRKVIEYTNKLSKSNTNKPVLVCNVVDTIFITMTFVYAIQVPIAIIFNFDEDVWALIIFELALFIIHFMYVLFDAYVRDFLLSYQMYQQNLELYFKKFIPLEELEKEGASFSKKIFVYLKCPKILKYKILPWVLIDFISLVPLDLLIFMLIPYSHVFTIIFRIVRAIKLIRIARCIKIAPFKSKIFHIPDETIVTDRVRLIVDIIQFLYWFSYGIHIVSLGFIVVTQLRLGEHWSDKYIHAIYWTFSTVTTVGYGDIEIIGTLEHIYTMVVMLFGVISYAVVVGQVSVILQQQNRVKESQLSALNDLTSLLQYYQVPTHLTRKITNYYIHVQEQSGASSFEKVINTLPKSMGSKLTSYAKIKVAKTFPIFNLVSNECLIALAEVLEYKHCEPKEMIIQYGDIGSHMYFLSYGKVEVYNSNQLLKGYIEHDSKRREPFFAEESLFYDTVHKQSVKAYDYCALLKLSRNALIEVSRRYKKLAYLIKLEIDTTKKKNKSLIIAKEFHFLKHISFHDVVDKLYHKSANDMLVEVFKRKSKWIKKLLALNKMEIDEESGDVIKPALRLKMKQIEEEVEKAHRSAGKDSSKKTLEVPPIEEVEEKLQKLTVNKLLDKIIEDPINAETYAKELKRVTVLIQENIDACKYSLKLTHTKSLMFARVFVRQAKLLLGPYEFINWQDYFLEGFNVIYHEALVFLKLKAIKKCSANCNLLLKYVPNSKFYSQLKVYRLYIQSCILDGNHNRGSRIIHHILKVIPPVYTRNLPIPESFVSSTADQLEKFKKQQKIDAEDKEDAITPGEVKLNFTSWLKEQEESVMDPFTEQMSEWIENELTFINEFLVRFNEKELNEVIKPCKDPLASGLMDCLSLAQPCFFGSSNPDKLYFTAISMVLGSLLIRYGYNNNISIGSFAVAQLELQQDPSYTKKILKYSKYLTKSNRIQHADTAYHFNLLSPVLSANFSNYLREFYKEFDNALIGTDLIWSPLAGIGALFSSLHSGFIFSPQCDFLRIQEYFKESHFHLFECVAFDVEQVMKELRVPIYDNEGYPPTTAYPSSIVGRVFDPDNVQEELHFDKDIPLRRYSRYFCQALFYYFRYRIDLAYEYIQKINTESLMLFPYIGIFFPFWKVIILSDKLKMSPDNDKFFNEFIEAFRMFYDYELLCNNFMSAEWYIVRAEYYQFISPIKLREDKEREDEIDADAQHRLKIAKEKNRRRRVIRQIEQEIAELRSKRKRLKEEILFDDPELDEIPSYQQSEYDFIMHLYERAVESGNYDNRPLISCIAQTRMLDYVDRVLDTQYIAKLIFRQMIRSWDSMLGTQHYTNFLKTYYMNYCSDNEIAELNALSTAMEGQSIESILVKTTHIKMEGWVYKQGSSHNKWKRYYFKLNSEGLSYAKNEFDIPIHTVQATHIRDVEKIEIPSLPNKINRFGFIVRMVENAIREDESGQRVANTVQSKSYKERINDRVKRMVQGDSRIERDMYLCATSYTDRDNWIDSLLPKKRFVISKAALEAEELPFSHDD